MAENFLMKNESTGQMKQTFLGYSWTMLFFNAFAPLFRGDFITFLALVGLNIAICLASPNIIFLFCVLFMPGFIYSFFWNKEYTKRLLAKGFGFAEDGNKNAYALAKYNTPNTAGYIFCAIYCGLNLMIAFQFVGDDSYSISSLFDSGSTSYLSSSLSGNQSSSKDELREVEPVGISPRGQLASIFNLMSDYTNLQRDEVFEKIRNKVIDWTLPIYEVRKINSNNYEITILPDKNVGCEVYISNPDEGELQTLRQIKTGDYINFKGRIADITPTRSLVIKPAIIYGEPITNMQKATFVYKECITESRTSLCGKIGNNNVCFYPGWYSNNYCNNLKPNQKYRIEFYKTYDLHDEEDVLILSNVDNIQ